MARNYRVTNKTTSLLNYTFVFCSKNRRKIFLIPGVKERAKDLIYKICLEENIRIENIECQDEHVILKLEAPPEISPTEIMQKIKSKTSKIIREEFESLSKVSSLWTRNFWVSTVQDDNSLQISEFINCQKKRS